MNRQNTNATAAAAANSINIDDFSNAQHWEQSYTSGFQRERTDWLCTFADLESSIEQHLTKGSEVIISGCGASPFPVQVLERFSSCRITAIDQCESLIERSKSMYHHLRQHITFQQADIRKGLKDVHSSSINLILDKTTLDSILCASSRAFEDIDLVLRTYHRILKPKGVLLVVSGGSPITRTRYFESAGFTVNRVLIVNEEHHVYLYECSLAASYIRNIERLSHNNAGKLPMPA